MQFEEEFVHRAAGSTSKLPNESEKWKELAGIILGDRSQSSLSKLIKKVGDFKLETPEEDRGVTFKGLNSGTKKKQKKGSQFNLTQNEFSKKGSFSFKNSQKSQDDKSLDSGESSRKKENRDKSVSFSAYAAAGNNSKSAIDARRKSSNSFKKRQSIHIKNYLEQRNLSRQLNANKT